jgi:hypothetical protein
MRIKSANFLRMEEICTFTRKRGGLLVDCCLLTFANTVPPLLDDLFALLPHSLRPLGEFDFETDDRPPSGPSKVLV